MTSDQRRSAATRRWVRDQFEGRPCHDCGGVFHWFAMQFDHRPGVRKLFEISKAGNRKRESILLEIEKCDVVCANCHAVRTHIHRRKK